MQQHGFSPMQQGHGYREVACQRGALAAVAGKGGNMHMSRLCVAVLGLFVFAAPAAAQSYEAEVDCNGLFQGGDTVPYQLRFEEQAHQQHVITVDVTLDGPGVTKNIISGKTFVLNSNQDKTISKSITLKANAPAGSYEIRLDTNDGTLFTTDSCSFTVN
jgi:hypothetical protein